MPHFETNSCFSADDVAKALMASFQGSHAALIFLRRRKFPLSCPCYHPQYVSTIFRISPLLVDKSYITSLGFSENSAPPDLNSCGYPPIFSQVDPEGSVLLVIGASQVKNLVRDYMLNTQPPDGH